MLKRLPDWLKAEYIKNTSTRVHDIKKLLRSLKLKTVCEEARCPNISRCFLKPSIAFMILGNNCTRNCSFCAVNHSKPEPIDPSEPQRIAKAVIKLGLKYVVITSVTRDDLYDCGAEHFANTINMIRDYSSYTKIEILTPDFKGNKKNIDIVVQAKPDVFNHNIETIPRLYPLIRPQANYLRSLGLLSYVKKISPYIYTKSGIMLGLGETIDEVIDVMKDLRNCGCDILTIGQYLRPTKENIPVKEYIGIDIFESLKTVAKEMGFRYVQSGPLVRSSMDAEKFISLLSSSLNLS